MFMTILTILNVYAAIEQNIKYMKLKLIELKEEIDKSTIIVWGFNISFSIIDRMCRQKISNYTIDNMKDTNYQGSLKKK